MSVDATSSTPEQSLTDHPHNHPADADAESFGLDDVFHLLQNQRRRRVLRYLRDVDETVAMSDVAEQVAAWEHGTTVEALTSNQRQRVYIALYQRHLPKLDDMGVIDYNQSRGLVTPRARAASVTTYLDLATDRDGLCSATRSTDDDGDSATVSVDEPETDTTERDTDTPWTTYALGTSGIAAVVLALTALDVSVFASISELGVAAVVLVAFLVLSLGRLRD